MTDAPAVWVPSYVVYCGLLAEGGDRVRRVVWLGVLFGLGALVASAFPDIRRYIKITRM